MTAMSRCDEGDTMRKIETVQELNALYGEPGEASLIKFTD